MEIKFTRDEIQKAAGITREFRAVINKRATEEAKKIDSLINFLTMRYDPSGVDDLKKMVKQLKEKLNVL